MVLQAAVFVNLLKQGLAPSVGLRGTVGAEAIDKKALKQGENIHERWQGLNLDCQNYRQIKWGKKNPNNIKHLSKNLGQQWNSVSVLWNCSGGMNTVFPKDGSWFDGDGREAQSDTSLQNLPYGVLLDWDMMTLKVVAYQLHHFHPHHSFKPCGRGHCNPERD